MRSDLIDFNDNPLKPKVIYDIHFNEQFDI